MEKFLVLFFSIIAINLNAQTGIGTISPNTSSILDVDVSALPANGKKGFLGPKVALISVTDQVTVGIPAKGLLVYNTANAGVPPQDVKADRYYFWSGTEWISLVGRKFIDEALIQKIFYSSSSALQTFLPADVNDTTEPGKDNLVNFANGSAIINTGNIVTLSNNLFTINRGGLYELSAMINYNPNGVVHSTSGYLNDRKVLNLKIQLSVNGSSGPWVDIANSRAFWSLGTSTYYKTITVAPTVYRLAQGNTLRVVIQNPAFAAGAFLHGTPTIGTTTYLPVSRALRLQLLDYNL